MSTRHQRRLFWPFAIALLGTSACAGGATTTSPVGTTQPGGGTTQPGGGGRQPGAGATKPGGGATQPGGTAGAPGARRVGGIPGQGRRAGGGETAGAGYDPQIDAVCADIGTTGEHGAQAAMDALKCESEDDGTEGGYAADGEIAGMLEAVHATEARESSYVEENAVNSSVRDFAHLMMISHGRALSENRALFERLSIQPDPASRRRTLEGGHLPGLDGARGGELDREYMRRQILEHQRTIRLVEEMLPRAENAEMRCALDKARHESMAHLEMACWIWDSLHGERGVGVERGARRARGQGGWGERGMGPQQSGEQMGDDDCEESSVEQAGGGEQVRKRRGQRVPID